MLQTDNIVNQGCHWSPRGFGIAVRQCHGDLFMTALDQFRHVVATIIHDRVVKTAKTGAWIACCIHYTASLEHIDDDIGTVLRPPLGSRREGMSSITDCRHDGSPLGKY